MIAAWPSPVGEEYALAFDKSRPHRVLVLPAWFDEASKLRHFTAEVMRRRGVASLLEELKAVNEDLWNIEDRIREKESEAQFGPDFIGLARSVYKRNDRRAALKRAINLRLSSELVEEKSYTANTPASFADDPSAALIHG